MSNPIWAVSKFFNNWRRYSQLKVYHRCRWHQWQIYRWCHWQEWQIYNKVHPVPPVTLVLLTLTGVNNTSVTGGTGCTLTCEYPWIFEKFKITLMLLSAAWGNWFMKKTWSKKSRDTFPLRFPLWKVFSQVSVQIRITDLFISGYYLMWNYHADCITNCNLFLGELQSGHCRTSLR